MVRGLEEFSRTLTCLRIGWSCIGFIASFAAAISVSVLRGEVACLGLPISLGIGGVAQLWDFIAHVMYLQDLWRPWLRGLKLFLYVGLALLLASIGAMGAFITMGVITTGSNFDMCSWNTATLSTLWPIFSSAQLTMHAKIYRDEFRDLRTLLDY